MFLSSKSQTAIYEGNVSGTWTSNDSPYLIEGDITVPADSILTIEPGVDIIFQGHYHFLVKGVLQAEGTREDSISFTIHDTTGFAQLDNFSSGWSGIHFIDNENLSDTSILKFCQIEYTVPDTAISGYFYNYGSVYVRGFDTHTVRVENCWIKNNRQPCHSYFGTLMVINCIISNNIGGGMRLIYDFGLIYGNIVTENESNSGIGGMFFAGHPVIINNTICFNTAPNGGGLIINDDGGTLKVYNSIIFGNEATVGAGSMAYSAWSSIHFYHCILEGIYQGDPGGDTISVNTTSYNDLFDDTSTPIYTLANNSLAIDSGLNEIYVNSVLITHPEFDVIGNPRIFNNRIDIGAIESQDASFIEDDKIDLTKVIAYPNPTQYLLNLDLKENYSTNTQITMVDMKGIQVFNKQFSKPPTEIVIDFLPKGLYILIIKSRNINRNQLIIKQ